jgi:hypothetical protein
MRRLSIVLTAVVAATSSAVGPAVAKQPAVCLELLHYDLGCVRL